MLNDIDWFESVKTCFFYIHTIIVIVHVKERLLWVEMEKYSLRLLLKK